MRWYVDDQLLYVRSLVRNFWSGIGENPYTDIRQPFDQSFNLIMHVSVGGNFFYDHGHGDFDQFRDPQRGVDKDWRLIMFEFTNKWYSLQQKKKKYRTRP
eukprot:TRINITY_DN2468_c0_g1_i2.p1 TRINITY_DN2468_c0_g1~~TRINITY_DN2468_c0_g1_i2.p1  ORF type:complete len:100 (+),score=5.99 TRINITY_DN2468_c0_g1_i2:173-472(+)